MPRQFLIIYQPDHCRLLGRKLGIPEPRRGFRPMLVGDRRQKVATKCLDPTGKHQKCIAKVEVADLTALFESPPISRRGREAHLAPNRNPEFASLLHGTKLHSKRSHRKA